jgi:hypothetical protein
MSTAIRRYPEHLRATVVARRVKAQSGGLGFWAARDAQRRLSRLGVEIARPERAHKQSALETELFEDVAA